MLIAVMLVWRLIESKDETRGNRKPISTLTKRLTSGGSLIATNKCLLDSSRRLTACQSWVGEHGHAVLRLQPHFDTILQINFWRKETKNASRPLNEGERCWWICKKIKCSNGVSVNHLDLSVLHKCYPSFRGILWFF